MYLGHHIDHFIIFQFWLNNYEYFFLHGPKRMLNLFAVLDRLKLVIDEKKSNNYNDLIIPYVSTKLNRIKNGNQVVAASREIQGAPSMLLSNAHTSLCISSTHD